MKKTIQGILCKAGSLKKKEDPSMQDNQSVSFKEHKAFFIKEPAIKNLYSSIINKGKRSFKAYSLVKVKHYSPCIN
jgi:hypothetical protein